jgi:DNA-binding response OmpR family regulator
MEQIQKARILVVEDDENIRRFVVINLERNGFEVMEASCGEHALQMAMIETPDLAVLDIMLPDIDGFEICKRLRMDLPDVAVILLTARGQDMDKVMGLELGADDYMVKPFNPLELVARIRAVLRRTAHVKHDENQLKSGPFELQIQSNTLYKRKMRIDLTPKEFQMMKVFLENQDKTLARDELLNLVWGNDFIGDPKTVDVHVRRLREKIEYTPSKPQFIETVWGYGYRWRKDG